MKKCSQFFSTLVSLLGLLYCTHSQEEMKHNGSGSCMARDGRDGLPGQPGLPGPAGTPGRDGRDCLNTLSMARIFELEKRLEQMDQKCQSLEMEGKRMKEDMEGYRRQTQELVRVLAGRKGMDTDVVGQVLESEIEVSQTSTDTSTSERNLDNELFGPKEFQTTGLPTTRFPTTENPTTENPTTENPTTENPTTENPTTENPTTENPTTENPTTENPTTENPTTENPTTENPTTRLPTTENPTTRLPTTENPTTRLPTTDDPTTENPTTENPTTRLPTTENPTTEDPTTENPTTENPTTENPTTQLPTTKNPTTRLPTTGDPTTRLPTTWIRTTRPPTSGNPTTENPKKVKEETSQGKTVEKPRTFYAMVMKNLKTTSGSGTKSSDSDTNNDDTTKRMKNVCAKRFHVHQKVKTRGAVNMEVFEVGNFTYLAVANFHIFGNKDGYNTTSFIYRMNPTSELFEKLQELPTIGCRALVSFKTGGNSYLVAANHYDGINHDLRSVIYKWNGTQFENFREVETSGASGAEFFTIAGESYLMFANYRNKTTVSVSSVIYKWRQGDLVLFQNLHTHGAVDCKFLQSKHGAFLAVANYYTPETLHNVESTVYKWNGERFVFLQNILTPAAISVDMFEESGFFFLALASNRKRGSWHSLSMVFRWDGEAFVSFQSITTTAAMKVHHFVDAKGALYLTVANYFDEITDFEAHSMVYKFDGERFLKFQGILTTGAYDLLPFRYKGMQYLASAFRFNGRNSSLDSTIYKMTTSCQSSNDLLP